MPANDSLSITDLPDDADNCAWCGAPLPDDFMWGYRRFCSSRCRMASYYHHNPDSRRVPIHGERPCQTCGKTFLAYTPKQRFCSQPCYWSAMKKPPRKPIACEECREAFVPADARRRFCSKPCASRYTARNRTPRKRRTKPLPTSTCRGCRKTFTPKRYRPSIVPRFCSRECYRENRAKAAKGE